MTVDVNAVITILANRDPGQPWMTSGTLAKKIGLKESDSTEVEECLYNYYKGFGKDGQPLIRYSNLPGRKTLELLWGHVNLVGPQKLADINKTDLADNSLNLERGSVEHSADVFISHSFKDYDHVIEIAKFLQCGGVTPWLAETHIGQGDHINQSVISALNKTASFVFFLSENSLSSKWSSKEFDYAKSRGIKIIIIADCSNKKIMDLVAWKLSKKRGKRPQLSPNTADIFLTIFNDEVFSSNEKNIPIVVYPEIPDHFTYAEDSIAFLDLEDLVRLLKNS